MVSELIKKYLKKVKNHTPKDDDDLKKDIGLDSLELISFFIFIEKSFGVVIKEKDFAKHLKLKTLCRHVSERKTKIIKTDITWKKILLDDYTLPLPSAGLSFLIIKYLSKLILKLKYGLRIIRKIEFPPHPFIIVSNHQSYLDPAIISSHIPLSIFKNCYYYAKTDHFGTKRKREFASNHNIIMVDTKNAVRESILKLALCLRKKNSIIMFPEGTRTKNGSVGEFKRGFALLSCGLNIPVVPVVINGAYKAVSTKGRKRITIEFLDAINPEGFNQHTLTKEVYETINKRCKN